MIYKDFLELVKKDTRKEIFELLEENKIKPSNFSNQKCIELHKEASVKVFEKLIKYGLNINFNKFIVLKTALYKETSTYSKYLQIAEQNNQEISFLRKFDYSLGGDIKYGAIKKSKNIIFS